MLSCRTVILTRPLNLCEVAGNCFWSLVGLVLHYVSFVVIAMSLEIFCFIMLGFLITGKKNENVIVKSMLKHVNSQN